MRRCGAFREDDAYGQIRCERPDGHRGLHEARIQRDENWGEHVRWGTNAQIAESWRDALATWQ